MAYPPTVPPASRVNTTPQADNHPSDHNALSAALTDIINELGANPGGSSTVDGRISANETRLSHLDGGWMTGGPGNVSSTGVYDLVVVNSGVTFTYDCRVFVDANIHFGFGSGGQVNAGADIMLLRDNSIPTPVRGPYVAATATWETIPVSYAWVAVAGSNVGFKVRGTFSPASTSPNCWLTADVNWWIYPAA